MSPLTKYQEAISAGQIQSDSAQLSALSRLDLLYHQLLKQETFWPRIKRAAFHLFRQPYAPIQGVYLWGEVGRGKTYLMDLFYHSIPFPHKKRMHFHRFMFEVHQSLRDLKGTPDPLEKIAKRFAKSYWLLCFDELFVQDIADAMILGGLLQALFAQGVTLVATSNLPPAALYRNGLQRERFMPAIEAIQRHCDVWEMKSEMDYRLRYLEQAELYHCPLDEAAEANLTRYFNDLSQSSDKITHPTTLIVSERPIVARKCADNVVWFDFDALCQGPRGTTDYIEIARSYHTVLLSGVPVMTAAMEDVARRFIALVDEFYERNVSLILSAAVKPEALYQGERLVFEFARTLSRLQEMQSTYYLAKPHLT